METQWGESFRYPAMTKEHDINSLGERAVKQAGMRDDRDWDDFMRGFGVGTVEYVYDAKGHLLGEYEARGSAVKRKPRRRRTGGSRPISLAGAGARLKWPHCRPRLGFSPR